MCHGRRIKKKKTHVKKSTLNPVYNEAIVFDVPRDNIEDVSLLVNVIDYDRYWLRRSQSPTTTCCGYAFVCACVRVCVCSCVRSSMRVDVRSFVLSFVRLFVCLFVRMFIYSRFVRSSVWQWRCANKQIVNLKWTIHVSVSMRRYST